ncbi:MAG: hypothetical protein ACE5FJ_08600 [Gemmatimonadales bacterium]
MNRGVWVRGLRLGRVAVLILAWLVPVTWSGCSGTHAISVAPPAPTGTVEFTMLLLGDAGGAAPGDQVLTAVRRHVIDSARTVIVFLGDNVYPEGLVSLGESGRSEGERRLGEQAAVARETGAFGLFVPGNHGWGPGGVAGLARIDAQQEFLDSALGSRGTFVPRNGCPGPVAVDLSDRVRLVALDTEWWLAQEAPELLVGRACLATRTEIYDSLHTLLAGAASREIVITAHHPLETEGPHGGRFTLKDHLFPLTNLKNWLWIPLPIVGSIYPIVRGLGVGEQDLSSSRYRAMRDEFAQAFAEFRPLAYAAGHEHNLQVIAGESVQYYLVSGAGYFDHTSPAGWRSETLFAGDESGFQKLEFTSTGRVRLSVWVVGANGTDREAFAVWIK